MSVNLISNNKCFAGEQRVYSHVSKELGCEMKFSIYLPAKALDDTKGKIRKTCSYKNLHRSFLKSSSGPVLPEWTDLQREQLCNKGWGSAVGQQAQLDYRLSRYIAQECGCTRRRRFLGLWLRRRILR